MIKLLFYFAKNAKLQYVQGTTEKLACDWMMVVSWTYFHLLSSGELVNSILKGIVFSKSTCVCQGACTISDYVDNACGIAFSLVKYDI